VSGLLSAPTVGAQVGASRNEDQLSTSHLDGDSHRVQVLEVLHGQLRPLPSRIQNPVREPELPGHGERLLLMVDYRIKVYMELQADKSPVVLKGPFFPRVVNPRYRIRGTMCNARIQSSKARKAIL
jgi:hypothetical protein